MNDRNTINKLESKKAELVAQIKNTYNTDPMWEVLHNQIAEINNQIAAIKAWSKVS